jgi:rubrerythrin
MELEQVLDRCLTFERRAASAYRRFAAATRGQPDLCALWTGLAREEEEHVQSIETALVDLRQRGKSRASVHGWDEAMAEIESRLAVAERLPAGATKAQQLAAALDIEMTEIDALRQLVLAAANPPVFEDHTGHVDRLADAAETLTDDPQVRLQVALLRARARLKRA